MVIKYVITVVPFFIQLKPHSLLPLVSTINSYVFLSLTSIQFCITARCQNVICILMLCKCAPYGMYLCIVLKLN
jgi:hypothetical protein